MAEALPGVYRHFREGELCFYTLHKYSEQAEIVVPKNETRLYRPQKPIEMIVCKTHRPNGRVSRYSHVRDLMEAYNTVCFKNRALSDRM